MLETHTLVDGHYVTPDDFDGPGTRVSFDGTYVQIGNREPRLGFKDSSGHIHVYTDDRCQGSLRLFTTLDPSVLVGATIQKVTGMKEGGRVVKITTNQGTLTMLHKQECCEVVEVLDVSGDPDDLVGGLIAVFEVRSGTRPGVRKAPRRRLTPTERIAWRHYTFYEIRTTKGDVTLRWGEPDDHDDNRYGEGITLSLNPLAKFNP